jgi:hypothetical protein
MERDRWREVDGERWIDRFGGESRYGWRVMNEEKRMKRGR